ncbi:hypothetical protein FA13DRAFT_1717369 [Coprinellus micaceus]|uniref:Uncharacterized protein n=1 Tax=Coprinellus micaceus TaxID=71717 RepID=A0A4Y7SGJ7_COPMI|nr:hypothetical protein FA13DRAFT_1717369 [Coprinellus micaceus]
MAIYYTSSGLTTGERVGIIIGVSVLILLISVGSYTVRKRQAERLRAEADRLAALQANQVRMDQLPPYTGAAPGYPPYGAPNAYGQPQMGYPQQPYSTLPPSMTGADSAQQFKTFSPPPPQQGAQGVPAAAVLAPNGGAPPVFPQPHVGVEAQAPAVPGPPAQVGAVPTGVPPAYQAQDGR